MKSVQELEKELRERLEKGEEKPDVLRSAAVLLREAMDRLRVVEKLLL